LHVHDSLYEKGGTGSKIGSGRNRPYSSSATSERKSLRRRSAFCIWIRVDGHAREKGRPGFRPAGREPDFCGVHSPDGPRGQYSGVRDSCAGAKPNLWILDALPARHADVDPAGGHLGEKKRRKETGRIYFYPGRPYGWGRLGAGGGAAFGLAVDDPATPSATETRNRPAERRLIVQSSDAGARRWLAVKRSRKYF
jgi:hypothetical protein